jgi:hypothetical protein
VKVLVTLTRPSPNRREDGAGLRQLYQTPGPCLKLCYQTALLERKAVFCLIEVTMDLRSIDTVENIAIDLVAKIAPWCAPIPTAYLVGRATVTHLNWPVSVGVLSAAVIESLGLVTCATALDLYHFNQTRRKSDPPAPFALSVVLIGLYFVVAVVLTVVLDILPTWSVIAPAIFPTLSLAGVTVIALRKDHQHRIQQIENEKAERKVERQTNRSLSRSETLLSTNTDLSNDLSNQQNIDVNFDKRQVARKAKLDNRLDALLDAFRNDPHLGVSDAARQLNVSRQTIYSYIDQLERAGKIHRNGYGTEVTEC